MNLPIGAAQRDASSLQASSLTSHALVSGILAVQAGYTAAQLSLPG